MRDWMADLRALPGDRIDVCHEPMTERYFRAISKRMVLARWGVFLGVRPTTAASVWEIAVWLENQTSPRKAGAYACFRVFYSEEMRPLSAILFCFYDGTEKSPAFRSEEAARIYAREGEFAHGI